MVAAVRPTRRRRRKQWWKPFASPRLLLLAIPVLVLPIAAILLEDDGPPSPIELAIGALPTAGGAAEAPETGKAARIALLGSSGSRLPNNVSLPLVANSAQAMGLALTKAETSAAVRQSDQDFLMVQFAALHPLTLAKDDLMIGSVDLIYQTPMMIDLSVKIFQEYCNAQPEDPFYAVDIDSLPIDGNLRKSLLRFASTADHGGAYCPRMRRDDFYYQ